MLKPIEEIWREGFMAADIYGSWCPYRADSCEFEVWEKGWMQGYLKREGCAYQDHPDIFNLSNFENINKGNESG